MIPFVSIQANAEADNTAVSRFLSLRQDPVRASLSELSLESQLKDDLWLLCVKCLKANKRVKAAVCIVRRPSSSETWPSRAKARLKRQWPFRGQRCEIAEKMSMRSRSALKLSRS